MRKLGNRGFFLAETIVVMTIVAAVLVLFYSQISGLYHSYENSTTYNTVDSISAANNVKQFILQEDIHAVMTSLGSNSIIDITNYSFTNASFYAGLLSNLNIKKVYFAKYNINSIIANPSSSGLTLDASTVQFLKTLNIVTNITSTTKYRLILAMNDNTYANLFIDTSDNIPPVLTLKGGSSIAVAKNGTYVDPGVTSIDNIDGDISSSVTSVGTVTTNTVGTYYITYTSTDAAGNIASLTRTVDVFQYATDFSYIKYGQTFTVPFTGTYKVELWGAQGASTNPGKGGYTSGTVPMTKGDNLYVYVGNHSETGNDTTYNGGTGTSGGPPGGGATDVRYYKKYRYIRDYLYNSVQYLGDHWVEIKALDPNGNNIAMNKPITASGTLVGGNLIDDNSVPALGAGMYGYMVENGYQYVEIDLGAEYPIATVQITHYYDSRTYNGTKTELYNSDRSDKFVVFDSAVSGTYSETGTRTYDLSLRDRIMVAAGGGSGGHATYAGGAGGLVGLRGLIATGGTQTSGGAQDGFGNGGWGYGGGGCGGGGGYFGGGGAACIDGGGGGSSFISGFNGCNAVDQLGNFTNQPDHWSGKVFTNGIMYDGASLMPIPAGGTETGHSGNGYARITYIP